MFVGHFGAAIVAKAVEPRVPLWALLLAAQLVDVLWAIFVFVGAEHVRLDPTLPSNPLDLYDMPYTHSLLGATFWAGGAALIAARAPWLGGTRRAAVVVGLVVLSHWVLDLLVHRPDLTLWGVPPKLGLGLWDAPLVAYMLELGFVAACAAFYALHREQSSRGVRGLVGAVAALAAIQTAVTFGPLPPSVPAIVLSMLVVFAGVSYTGLRSERRPRQTSP